MVLFDSLEEIITMSPCFVLGLFSSFLLYLIYIMSQLFSYTSISPTKTELLKSKELDIHLYISNPQHSTKPKVVELLKKWINEPYNHWIYEREKAVSLVDGTDTWRKDYAHQRGMKCKSLCKDGTSCWSCILIDRKIYIVSEILLSHFLGLSCR